MSAHPLQSLLLLINTPNKNEIDTLHLPSYFNDKMSQIGWNILHSLLINEVFLKHHLSQREFDEVKQKLIEKMSEVDLQVEEVMKRLGELYREGKFIIINQIEEKMLLIVEQIITNIKRNAEENPSIGQKNIGLLDCQKQQQMEAQIINIEEKGTDNCSLDTFYSFKTFIDDFTIIVPSLISIFQDPTKSILSHAMNSSHDESVFLNTRESPPSLQHSIFPAMLNSHQKANSPLSKYYQQENIDPDNPVVFYLENDVEEVFQELTHLLHHFNLPHPIFNESLESDKKYTVQCTISIPTCNQQQFSKSQYSSVGRGYSSKTSKTQACKRILINLYSQNPHVWTQFKHKKCIDGITT